MSKKYRCPECRKRTFYLSQSGYTCDSCKRLFDDIRVHPENEPDVPDLVRPGDWITDEENYGPYMVVKVTKHQEGEWDYCPGAESWTIHVLGSGYMTEGNVSDHDCGFLNDVVAVGGRLLQLYKLGWNDGEELMIVPKPDYVTVSRSAKALLGRSAQMLMELG